MTTRCPHPEKVRHRSRKAAEKHLASMYADKGVDLGLRPYRCGDHWHLGHQAKTVPIKQQLRRALAAGRKNSRRRRRAR